MGIGSKGGPANVVRARKFVGSHVNKGNSGESMGASDWE